MPVRGLIAILEGLAGWTFGRPSLYRKKDMQPFVSCTNNSNNHAQLHLEEAHSARQPVVFCVKLNYEISHKCSHVSFSKHKILLMEFYIFLFCIIFKTIKNVRTYIHTYRQTNKTLLNCFQFVLGIFFLVCCRQFKTLIQFVV